MSYPDPVYSHKLATTPSNGATVDIATATMPGYPPVMIAVVSDVGMVYTIEGSHDGIAFVDFSGGGFSESEAKDLIPGVRFWRTVIVSNSGSATLTSSVGAVPTHEGGTRMVNPRTTSTNVTATQ